MPSQAPAPDTPRVALIIPDSHRNYHKDDYIVVPAFFLQSMASAAGLTAPRSRRGGAEPANPGGTSSGTGAHGGACFVLLSHVRILLVYEGHYMPLAPDVERK